MTEAESLDKDEKKDIRRVIIDSFKLKQEKLKNISREIQDMQEELGVEGDRYS